MPNILLNYQSKNLRYAVEELSEHNLFSWRDLTSDFAKKSAPKLHKNIIKNYDFENISKDELAAKIKEICKVHSIDMIFPLYMDTVFPYLHDILNFTTEQSNILSNKEIYTEVARDIGIPVPRTYTDIKKAQYPIIAKPVNGSASIGVKVLKDYSDYFFFVSGEDIQYNDLGKYYIFQDFIDGITVSSAGRVVDGEVLFDISYNIELSDLPYRAETGFVLMPNVDIDIILKNYIKLLAKKLELKNCAWMADFIFSNGEFFLVDFSPRLSVSAQVLVKHSTGLCYNKLITNSLLYKDTTKVNLQKCVIYRYFDIPKGKHQLTFEGDKNLAEELVLPSTETYHSRMDVLMPFKGYAVTVGNTLQEAEEKYQTLVKSLKVI